MTGGYGGVLNIARRISQVGVAGWAVTGRRRLDGGVLKITAPAWTAGFQWWRSGDITRTQNDSEYTLVLALCLVTFQCFLQSFGVQKYELMNDLFTNKSTKYKRKYSRMGWLIQKARKVCSYS